MIKKPWFAVKRHGYGVGLPIAWQGWVALTTFVFTATLAGILLPSPINLVVIVLVGGVFAWIAHARSDAQWDWRNEG